MTTIPTKDYSLMVRLIRGGRYYGREISRLSGYSAEYVRQVAKSLSIEIPQGKKPPLEVACQVCGKKTIIAHFEKKKKKYFRLGYCSVACYKKIELYEQLTCPCGKIFSVRRYRHRYHARKYCSRQCFQKAWHKSRTVQAEKKNAQV